MNSFDDQDLVYLFMDGEMDPGDLSRFEQRLAEEPKLAALLAEAQAISVQTRELLDVEVPLGLSTRIMAQVKEEPAGSEGLLERLTKALQIHWPVPVAVAAALVLFFSFGLGEQTETYQQLRPVLPEQVQQADPQPQVAAGAVEIEDLDANDDYDIMIYLAPGSSNQLIWLTPKAPEEEG